MTKIGAVIVTYNVDEILYNTVKVCEEQVENIVIVDNASGSRTKEIINNISKIYSNISIIYNEENYGIAKALNTGIEELLNLGCDWIITLDHDSVLGANMIKKMIQTYNGICNNDKIMVLAPEIYDINLNKKTRSVVSGEYEYKENIIQSGALYKKEVFHKIGLFNEELYIYCVDDEHNYRIINNGYNIIMVKDAILNHEEGKKIIKNIFGRTFIYDNYSSLSIYYIIRNCIYMYKISNDKVYKRRVFTDFIKILLCEPKKVKYVILGIIDGKRHKMYKFS